MDESPLVGAPAQQALIVNQEPLEVVLAAGEPIRIDVARVSLSVWQWASLFIMQFLAALLISVVLVPVLFLLGSMFSALILGGISNAIGA